MRSVVILFFIISCVGNAQQDQLSYSSNLLFKSNFSPDEKIKKADSLYLKLKEQQDLKLLSQFTDQYSFWLFKNDNDKCYQIGKDAAIYTLKDSPDDTTRVQTQWYNIAQFYYHRDANFDSTAVYLNKIISYNNSNKNAAIAYKLTGDIYTKKGDFYTALEYHMLAKSILIKKNAYTRLHDVYIALYRDHCQFKKTKNYLTARTYLEKADSLHAIYPQKFSKEFQMLFYLGQSYNQFETLDIPKAQKYFAQAFELAKKNTDTLRMGKALERLGNLYNTSDYTKSIMYLKRSMAMRLKTAPDELYIDHSNIAGTNLYHNKYDQAVYHFNKALKLATGLSIEEKSLQQVQQIYQLKNLEDILTILTDLGTAYHKINTTSSNSKALKTFQLADEVLDIIRFNSVNKNSRLHWREQASQLYSQAMALSWKQKNTKLLYYFMEKSKSIVLQEDIEYHQNKLNKNIPKPLINTANELAKELYILEKKSKLSTDDSLQKKMIKNKEALIAINDSIKFYNKNFNRSNKNKINKLNSIQENLLSNEAILEYSIFDDRAYALVITQDEHAFYPIDNVTELRQTCEKFLELISTPFKKASDQVRYNQNAKRLYEILIPNDTIIKNKDKLTIIPDNYLSRIPFEALINRNNTYLINEKKITYNFSNSLSNLLNKTHYKTANATLFAPIKFQNSKLSNLNYSEDEVNRIARVFDSDQKLREAATKDAFLEALGENSILHLSTHAEANNTVTPWIAFYDKKIDLDELYLTTNQANLVVLSACNTHTGTLAKGEGVMSLTRGFFQTGTKSVLASLWNVDDRSTAHIMSNFYSYLGEGLSKDKALQKAKQEYLKHSSLSEASPYYWAPFILMGNTNSIELAQNHGVLYSIVGILLILLIGLFVRYRPRKIRRFKE